MSVRIMTKIWDMQEFSPVEKLCLLALADWANDEGYAWPSITRIASKTGCAPRTVQKAFRKAETIGLMTCERIAGKGNKYKIDPCTTCTGAPQTPVHHVQGTHAPRAPNTLRHTNVDKAKALPTKRAAKKPLAKPVGVSDEIWIDFKAHRKAKNAPVSQTAINGIAREAERAGWSLEDALAECVARGWQGFKADWVKETKNGQRNGSSTERAVAGARARMAALEGQGSASNGRSGMERIGQMPDALRAIGDERR